MARGTAWSLGAYAATQLLRLGSNMILWRLLVPDVFGLISLVWSVNTGLMMFSDVGIGPSIIQRKEGTDERYLNTAWTIQTMRGLALFAASVAVAYPVAAFYKEPELGPVLIVVGAQSILSGFNSTRLFTATRDISLGRVTIIELSMQIASLVGTIAYALVSPTVWAIVFGGVCGALLKLVLSHVILPGVKNRFCFDREHARNLISFGRWVFVSTLMTFAAMQSDRLIFGALVSMEQLGVYNIANVWAAIPHAVLGGIFGSVVFPALCRLNESGGDFGALYRSMRAPWMIFGGWLCCALLVGGPALIEALYDERAKDAEWIVQILACSTWFYLLENANGTALLAKGYPKYVAAGNACKFVGMVVLIPLGFERYGFLGAVGAYALAEVLRYVTSVYLLARLGIATMATDLVLMLVAAASAGFAYLVNEQVRGSLQAWLAHVPRGPALAEALLVGLLTGVVWGARFWWHRARGQMVAASSHA
jgi:O-antigen/teichoic acid export membrane protein